MPTYLLYGEDTFSSRQKLKEIKSRFKNKQGDLNLTILDGENLSFSEFQKQIQSLPFLSQKRLVIIKNFLLKNKDQKLSKKLEKLLDKIPEETILFFYEQGLPEKSELFNKLNRLKKAQEFPLLRGYKLENWIKEEVENKGGKIEKEAVYLLESIVGSDLWRMENEIEKLVLFVASGKNKEPIKKEDVAFLVKSEIHPSIFALVDALGERDIKKATTLLHQLLSEGQSETYILSMIAYQFRNLLLVLDGSTSGLHPFVLEKTKRQLKNFDKKQLKNIYNNLLLTDYQIKTGAIKPSLALDLFISEL